MNQWNQNRLTATLGIEFSGKYSHRTITGGVGHNLLQEAPESFAQAVIDVEGYAKMSHAS
ncbi:MAG: hypothetical protein ACJ8BF_01325 [Gemmatimonadales bacterium]